MGLLKNGSISLLFLMIAASGFAQSAATETQPPSNETAPAARMARRRNYGPPCWKQAGMTPDMVNQRWKIEDQQKLNIAAVCTDASTSPQQKHDKIEQIHANTAQAVAKVIPSDTLAKFNKCQADLVKSRPASASKKELGPCGGTLPAPASDTAGMEHHHDGTKQ